MKVNLAAPRARVTIAQTQLLLLHQVGRVFSGLPAVLIGSLAKEIGSLGQAGLEG